MCSKCIFYLVTVWYGECLILVIKSTSKRASFIKKQTNMINRSKYHVKLSLVYLFIAREVQNLIFWENWAVKYVFFRLQRHFNASVGWFSHWRRCSGKSLYSHLSVSADTHSGMWPGFFILARLDSLCDSWLPARLFSPCCRFKFSIIVTQQEVFVAHVSMTTAGTPGQVISVELAI